MVEKEKDLQLIGQGSYGCVFRPNIECKSKQVGSANFLSKIQNNDKVLQNEIEISKKIPNSARFAGIIKSCPITVGEIGKTGIKKCKMLQEDAKLNLISNIVRFAGKETISNYLQKLITTKYRKTVRSEIYIKKVINSHLYLLRSILLLNTSNVLHLDIKYNNIMMREENPVIIDFGLSYDKANLNIDKYKARKTTRPFGIAVDYYIPWCFEIILLSHVSRYISVTDKNNNIKLLIDEEKERHSITDKEVKIMEGILNKYIEEHKVFEMIIFTAQEKHAFKENMLAWLITMKGNTWREAWNIITKSASSWDNYGLSVMYLMELEISGLSQLSKADTEGFLTNYIKELKKVILSVPNERSMPEDLSMTLTRLFRKIKKSEHKEHVRALTALLKDKENIKKMKEVRSVRELDSVQKTEFIKKQLVKG